MPCGLQSGHGCKWSHDHQELLKIVVPKLKEYEKAADNPQVDSWCIGVD